MYTYHDRGEPQVSSISWATRSATLYVLARGVYLAWGKYLLLNSTFYLIAEIRRGWVQIILHSAPLFVIMHWQISNLETKMFQVLLGLYLSCSSSCSKINVGSCVVLPDPDYEISWKNNKHCGTFPQLSSLKFYLFLQLVPSHGFSSQFLVNFPYKSKRLENKIFGTNIE